jgi:hypothetical protein
MTVPVSNATVIRAAVLGDYNPLLGQSGLALATSLDCSILPVRYMNRVWHKVFNCNVPTFLEW